MDVLVRISDEETRDDKLEALSIVYKFAKTKDLQCNDLDYDEPYFTISIPNVRENYFEELRTRLYKFKTVNYKLVTTSSGYDRM